SVAGPLPSCGSPASSPNSSPSSGAWGSGPGLPPDTLTPRPYRPPHPGCWPATRRPDAFLAGCGSVLPAPHAAALRPATAPTAGPAPNDPRHPGTVRGASAAPAAFGSPWSDTAARGCDAATDAGCG